MYVGKVWCGQGGFRHCLKIWQTLWLRQTDASKLLVWLELKGCCLVFSQLLALRTHLGLFFRDTKVQLLSVKRKWTKSFYIEIMLIIYFPLKQPAEGWFSSWWGSVRLIILQSIRNSNRQPSSPKSDSQTSKLLLPWTGFQSRNKNRLKTDQLSAKEERKTDWFAFLLMLRLRISDSKWGRRKCFTQGHFKLDTWAQTSDPYSYFAICCDTADVWSLYI